MLMSLACDMRHVMSWSLALCGQDLADKQFMRMDWNNRMYYTWCISSTFPPPTVSTVPAPTFCQRFVLRGRNLWRPKSNLKAESAHDPSLVHHDLHQRGGVHFIGRNGSFATLVRPRRKWQVTHICDMRLNGTAATWLSVELQGPLEWSRMHGSAEEARKETLLQAVSGITNNTTGNFFQKQVGQLVFSVCLCSRAPGVPQQPNSSTLPGHSLRQAGDVLEYMLYFPVFCERLAYACLRAPV